MRDHSLDALNTLIWRTFGIRRGKFRIPNTRGCETDVFETGEYPSLFFLKLYFTERVKELWKNEHRIFFPNKCCVCCRKMDFTISCYQPLILFNGQRTGSVLNGVPHCGTHGRDGKSHIVACVEWKKEFLTSIIISGQNAEFLKETRAMNHVGDVFPPWKAFPHRAELVYGWNQGTEEIWWYGVWDEFWRSMAEHPRLEYLEKWQAPKLWRDYLMTYPFGNSGWAENS